MKLTLSVHEDINFYKKAFRAEVNTGNMVYTSTIDLAANIFVDTPSCTLNSMIANYLTSGFQKLHVFSGEQLEEFRENISSMLTKGSDTLTNGGAVATELSKGPVAHMNSYTSATVVPTFPAQPSVNTELSEASWDLPGINSLVLFPCDCWNTTAKETLRQVIMHLNDKHVEGKKNDVWTRERIADWLDNLHDDGMIDIEFQKWDDQLEGETNGRSD